MNLINLSLAQSAILHGIIVMG